MKLSGSHVIPAPPQDVWNAVHNPDVLLAIVPGAQSVTQVNPSSFNSAVRVKIGPVSATFNAVISIKNPEPHSKLVIEGSAQGAAAGFAKGSAVVSLEPQENNHTLLSYQADASIGGRLAQIGQRLVNAAASHLSKAFFQNLVNHFSPQPDVPDKPSKTRVKLIVAAAVVIVAAVIALLVSYS